MSEYWLPSFLPPLCEKMYLLWWIMIRLGLSWKSLMSATYSFQEQIVCFFATTTRDSVPQVALRQPLLNLYQFILNIFSACFFFLHLFCKTFLDEHTKRRWLKTLMEDSKIVKKEDARNCQQSSKFCQSFARVSLCTLVWLKWFVFKNSSVDVRAWASVVCFLWEFCSEKPDDKALTFEKNQWNIFLKNMIFLLDHCARVAACSLECEISVKLFFLWGTHTKV